MKKPVIAAYVFLLAMSAMFWLIVYTSLFLTKNLNLWYYDFFSNTTEQLIGLLLIPTIALIAWTVKKLVYEN